MYLNGLTEFIYKEILATVDTNIVLISATCSTDLTNIW
jgi:hypothetical protein